MAGPESGTQQRVRRPEQQRGLRRHPLPIVGWGPCRTGVEQQVAVMRAISQVVDHQQSSDMRPYRRLPAGVELVVIHDDPIRIDRKVREERGGIPRGIDFRARVDQA